MHVDPLPLVPPTVMMGNVGARSSSAYTCSTRSSPISIVLGMELLKPQQPIGKRA